MPVEIHYASIDRQIALAQVLKCEHNFISALGILREKFLHLSLCKANNVVIGGGTVAHFFTATLAQVDDHPPFLGMLIDTDGLHEAKTDRCSVSRSCFIDMFAEEAHRAVIAAGTIGEIVYRTRTIFAREGHLYGYEDHALIILSGF